MRALLCLAAVGLGFVAAPASAGVIAHRAEYAVRLAHANSGSSIQGLKGSLVLDIGRTCEIESVTQVLQSRFWDHEGILTEGILTVSSQERIDGTAFVFTLKNLIEGTEVEQFSGRAERPAPGAEGEIRYDQAEYSGGPLPAESIFPGAHLSKLIAAAKAGERRVEAIVFDGDDEARSFKAVAIIGRGSKADLVDERADGLEGLERWPVALSYFPLGSDDPTPDYEISFGLYENGVSDDLLMDYGDFAMEGNLVRLGVKPEIECAER